MRLELSLAPLSRPLFPFPSLPSPTWPEFRSENEEIEKAIEAVSSQTQGRGVWVLDRGGDREKLLWYLVKNKYHFLVRLRQDRHLVFHGRKIAALEIAATCPMLYAETIVKEERDQEKILRIEFGYRSVSLPDRDVLILHHKIDIQLPAPLLLQSPPR